MASVLAPITALARFSIRTRSGRSPRDGLASSSRSWTGAASCCAPGPTSGQACAAASCVGAPLEAPQRGHSKRDVTTVDRGRRRSVPTRSRAGGGGPTRLASRRSSRGPGASHEARARRGFRTVRAAPRTHLRLPHPLRSSAIRQPVCWRRRIARSARGGSLGATPPGCDGHERRDRPYRARRG
jgi:hypothetical protein